MELEQAVVPGKWPVHSKLVLLMCHSFFIFLVVFLHFFLNQLFCCWSDTAEKMPNHVVLSPQITHDHERDKPESEHISVLLKWFNSGRGGLGFFFLFCILVELIISWEYNWSTCLWPYMFECMLWIHAIFWFRSVPQWPVFALPTDYHGCNLVLHFSLYSHGTPV